MKYRSSILLVLWLVFAVPACCVSVQRVSLTLPTAAESDLDALLDRYRLAADANIRVATLGQSESMSYHLVQIRHGEAPHLHATHDLAVTMMRGEGVLHVGASEQVMRPGDVAVVPRGTAHFFVNTGRQPAAAFVTFAPSYDGKDQVPVH